MSEVSLRLARVISLWNLEVVKTLQYPTRFIGKDAKLKDALEQSAKATGQSVNQLILACVRTALPQVVEVLSPGTGRITNVEPLSDTVLDRIYRIPEEEDEEGVKQFMAAQAVGGTD